MSATPKLQLGRADCEQKKQPIQQQTIADYLDTGGRVKNTFHIYYWG